MANSCAQNMNSLYSKEDLFKLFYDLVDQNVIEDILEYRNNDLTMAHQDLLNITSSSDLRPEHLHLSLLNENGNQSAVTDSDTTNFIDEDRLSNNETPFNKIIYLISKNCKIMVLMRGCPGSGKSFQAINILNSCYQNANVDSFIFSADKYFINKRTNEYTFKRTELKSAHTWAYNKAKKAVKLNFTPVIIDNTNVEFWEMNKYVELAVIHGYWIEIIEPVSEWAWDAKKLCKKNTHSVPYDTINLMLQRYDHNITRENLLTKCNLKYAINNVPPKRSSRPRKYQLAENLLEKKEVVNTPLTEINDLFVNDQFKNCKSQNHGNTKNNQCTSSDNSEDCGLESLIQEKESHVVSEPKNSSYTILNVDEDQFTSSDEGASKYVNKIVNTNENELNCPDKISKEEYNSCVRFDKNRDINERNQKQNVFNLSTGKSDKGTSTNDQQDNFPDISISYVTELHKNLKGNIECIWKCLTDSGYSLSKQQLKNFLQILEIENKIGPKQKNHKKKSNSKKKFKTIGENPENKFAFDDSLNSQVKRNENILDGDNIISHSIIENLISVKDEQKFVHLIVKTSVLAQLCDYFHDLSSNLNKKIFMSVQIPETLATDLYYYLITNVSHIFNEETIMQDEILTRKFKSIGENLENNFAFDDSLGLQVKRNENILDRDNIISDSISENLISVKDDKQKSVYLIVETSVLAQLCGYFHDLTSNLNKNILMTAQIPETLALDLYCYLITNVSHICNQETIMQDKILASKLQVKGNAQKKYPCKDSNHFSEKMSFSAVLSKPKSSKIYKNDNPNSNFNYQDTCNSLDNEYGIVSPNSPITQDSPSILKKENMYEVKSNEPSNQNYEQQVIKYSRMKNLCLQKSKESISRRHPEVARHLLNKAKQFEELENLAKCKCVEKKFKNKMNLKEIDLHHLLVLEAIHILDLFLDNHISILRKPNGGNRISERITIITGRGRHSPNHIARIKPAVLKRISERSISNEKHKDEGIILVCIKNNSLLTSEID